MANGQLLFTHPNKSLHRQRLVVPVKPNQISWSYSLNTANFPTYGGEVVQILSCTIEDMTVTGDIMHYHQLEEIYRYFIDIIQISTQGRKGTDSFDPRPVHMFYPERGWKFALIPKQLPAFTYARDLSAPSWTMVAAVAEPDQDAKVKIIDKAMQQAIQSDGDFKLFGTVTGDIGYSTNDPFRSPPTSAKERKAQTHQVADFFNHLLPTYLSGDYSELKSDYSKPVQFKIGPTGSSGPNQPGHPGQGGKGGGKGNQNNG